jgi:hypothetical protein
MPGAVNRFVRKPGLGILEGFPQIASRFGPEIESVRIENLNSVEM